MALRRQREIRMLRAGGDSDTEQSVPQQQYDDLVERGGQALRIASDDPDILVLYDQVDGSSMRVERGLALQSHLVKHVAVCSACRAPAIADSKGQQNIAAHIKAAVENSVTHQGAEALDMITPTATGKRCSACDATYLSRPQHVHGHIERAIAAGPQHANATVQVIQRFSLEPPVLEQPTATPVVQEATVPFSREGDRSEPSRRRRRHRQRKGSGA
jgi:hypothetical protein